MFAPTACSALRQGKRLQLFYKGFNRVVEVHAVGVTAEGNEVARVWQVRGGSNSGNPLPWRVLRLDKALSATIIDEKSEAPRSGYVRGDEGMARIICQI